MKKWAVLLITLLLLFTYSASADMYNEYMEPKIGLYFGSSALDTVKLYSYGGFNVCLGEAGEFAYRFSLLEDEITVTKCGSTDFYINGNHFATTGEFALKPAYGVVSVNGAAYRGFILLRRQQGSDMTVINILSLEDYLASVIGKEMSPSWNIEALKAQAVCARSYTWTHLNKYVNYGFDLDTTQNCQVYPGLSSETESTRLAVALTAGQTIRYNGKPVEALYFSSDGGATESAVNVWGGDLPYLVGVEDPYENSSEATKYSWDVTLTPSDIKTKLLSRNVSVGEILNIEITQKSEMGRAIEIKITGTEGSYSVKRTDTKTFFGLYSQPHSVVKQEDGTYVFSGGGWGHSVGLSQWGAKAMADMGFNYKDILTHYYTGVEIY